MSSFYNFSMGKIYTIFLKNRCPTSGIRRWEKKNCMCRHTIFCSYCRYYGHYYYPMATVVTTVVTALAMENHMTTHAIFFLINRCPMSGTIFKKKSSFKDDNDDNAKVHAVHPGSKEQWAKNNDAIVGTCWACGVLLRHQNPLKLRVSQAAGAHGDNGFGEMRMYLLKSYNFTTVVHQNRIWFLKFS